jgi:hypothetical protein
MAETSKTMPEATPEATPEPAVDAPSPTEEAPPPEPAQPPEAAPKKKGRPPGSKDKQQRKKPQVRIEPIKSKPAEQAEPSEPIEKPVLPIASRRAAEQPEPTPQQEPESPRTLRLKHTREVAYYRGLEADSRAKRVYEKCIGCTMLVM